jgi:hypothetical protein
MNNNVLKIIEDLGLDIDEFSQSVVIRNIENPFCEAWTIVYDSPGIPNNSTAMFSCFVKRDLEDTILDGQDWLKHSDEFSPGFSVCGGETQYFTGQDEGYEPIILSQCFYAFEETQLLLNQEFILLLGLYKDSNGDYYSIGDSGEKEKVVEFAPTSVKVRTKYILRYMSAKQLLYVQFVDSRVSSPGRYPFNPVHYNGPAK